MSLTKKTPCIHVREISMLIDVREHVLDFSKALRLVKKLPSFQMNQAKKKKVLKLSSKLHTRIHVIDHQIHALDCLCKDVCGNPERVLIIGEKSIAGV